jgi:hypothetical protein
MDGVPQLRHVSGPVEHIIVAGRRSERRVGCRFGFGFGFRFAVGFRFGVGFGFGLRQSLAGLLRYFRPLALLACLQCRVRVSGSTHSTYPCRLPRH